MRLARAAPQKASPVDAKEKNASTGSPFGFWMKGLGVAAKVGAAFSRSSRSNRRLKASDRLQCEIVSDLSLFGGYGFAGAKGVMSIEFASAWYPARFGCR